MAKVVGSGYLGSKQQETSVANQEIIPTTPSNWTTSYFLKKFSFANEQNCVVKVNGVEIFLRAAQGFKMDVHDSPVYSFIVVDAGIQFNWVGMY